MLFIVYWLLELKPEHENIRLLFINYKINNPEPLIWLSHLILFYFAWRFFLNTRNRVKSGYQKTLTSSLRNRNGWFYKLLVDRATSHYKNNFKFGFQQERSKEAKKREIKNINNNDFRVSPINFQHKSGALSLEYQSVYNEPRIPGYDFKNYTITYKGYQWLWYKFWKLIVFLSNKEDAPDYLIPWLLFILALVSSTLNWFGINASDLGDLFS